MDAGGGGSAGKSSLSSTDGNCSIG